MLTVDDGLIYCVCMWQHFEHGTGVFMKTGKLDKCLGGYFTSAKKGPLRFQLQLSCFIQMHSPCDSCHCEDIHRALKLITVSSSECPCV